MTLAVESVSPAALVVAVSLPEIADCGKMASYSDAEPKTKKNQDPQDADEEEEDQVENEKENAESAVEEVNQAQTQAQEDSAATEQSKSKKHVRFDAADVLEFEPSAWTATVSSDGVPVGMSGTLRRRTRQRLDSYENERCLCRVRREEYMEHGYLEPDERLEILENAGHSISVISHVEKETIRINRERWESNEYDLMYQYGLGEVPVMEMSDDEDEDMMFLAHQDSADEDIGMMMQIDDSSDECNQEESYYYSSRNVLVDAEVRFAMEEMDAYDTRRYEELHVDYAADCILGDDDDNTDENNELPYAKDSFESPLSFALSEMSSSPTDVSSAAECMIVSCSSRNSKAGAAAFGGGIGSASTPGDSQMMRLF